MSVRIEVAWPGGAALRFSPGCLDGAVGGEIALADGLTGRLTGYDVVEDGREVRLHVELGDEAARAFTGLHPDLGPLRWRLQR